MSEIKLEVIKTLENNQLNYSEKQLENIVYCHNFIKENIKNKDEVATSMWINHLLVFFKRLEGKEDLKLEGIEEMLGSLKTESVDLAREMVKKIAEDYGMQIAEAEVFLIATHIENLIEGV